MDSNQPQAGDEERRSLTMAPPPEGVIAGESIPRENEEDDWDETVIRDAMATLKQRGKPYVEMSDSELREKAIEALRKSGTQI